MTHWLLAAVLLVGAAQSADVKPRVLLAPYTGIITPVASEFYRGAIRRAEDEKFDAVVLQLDTPGGLDLSMREIIKAIMGARVPVIVYVHPTGSRAASAGVFITMAAHVAAMTPGTNIGAAHPVALPTISLPKDEKKGGDKVLEGKMVNDAAAYLKSIAQKRERNEDWAYAAVSKSTSIPAGEALSLGVIDIVSPDLPSLLGDIDGKKLADFDRPLRTAGAVIVREEMTRRQRWLAAIANPNVAMILMSLGAGGLFIELYNPGLILPGIIGAICLLLAFYAFETLSASYAGILLIVSGIVFLLLEIKVTSFGLLALGGVAAMFLGVLMLFQQSMGGLSVSWGVIVSSIGGLAALTFLISYVVYRVYRRRPASGMEGMVGEEGVTLDVLDPVGQVRVHGEIWEAESLSGELGKGAEIVVEDGSRLRLKVRKK
ncbi:MAG: nodulation protein NfeD [Elusimicrobiota bacterium]